MVWLRPVVLAACVVGCGAGRRDLSAAELLRCAAPINRVKALGQHYVVATTLDGFSLAVHRSTRDTADIVSDSILKYGFYEGSRASDTMVYAARHAPPAEGCADPPCHSGGVLVDVGANLGWWTFTAASQGWKVVAVEGAPSNAAMLALSRCINANLADLVEVRESLVADVAGACAIAFPKQNIGDGQMFCELRGERVDWTDAHLAALVKDSEALPEEQRLARAVRVPLTTLDDVLDSAWSADRTLPAAPTLMKLDIEGSEFRALKGAARWLGAGRFSVVHTEVWKALKGGTPLEFLNYMDGHGFKIAPAPCGSAWMARGILGHFVDRMNGIEELCMTHEPPASAPLTAPPAAHHSAGHRVGRRVRHDGSGAPPAKAASVAVGPAAAPSGCGRERGEMARLALEAAAARMEAERRETEVHLLQAEMRMKDGELADRADPGAQVRALKEQVELLEGDMEQLRRQLEKASMRGTSHAPHRMAAAPTAPACPSMDVLQTLFCCAVAFAGGYVARPLRPRRGR